LKDKRGMLQGKLLQEKHWQREHALLSPKYWLVLYLKKRRWKGL
jgi:hypothetical protein